MKIKKINWFIIIIYTGISIMMTFKLLISEPFFRSSIASKIAAGILFFIFAFILCLLFYQRLLYWAGKKMTLNYLKRQNFIPNQVFYSHNLSTYVDLKNGKIGVLLKWNPLHPYIVDASQLKEAHTDMPESRSTRSVTFSYTLYNTSFVSFVFLSKHYYNTQSNKVLEAISKADLMVDSLLTAKKIACQRKQI